MMRNIFACGGGSNLSNEPKTIHCLEQRTCFWERCWFYAGNNQHPNKRWVIPCTKLVNLPWDYQKTGKKEKLNGDLPFHHKISQWLCFELLATGNTMFRRYLIGSNRDFMIGIFRHRNVAVDFAAMGPMTAFCASELVYPKLIARAQLRKFIIAMSSARGLLCAA